MFKRGRGLRQFVTLGDVLLVLGYFFQSRSLRALKQPTSAGLRGSAAATIWKVSNYAQTRPTTAEQTRDAAETLFRKVPPGLPASQRGHRAQRQAGRYFAWRQKIGIEITNLYIEPGYAPESEQCQRGMRNKVVSEAQRIFAEQTGKNVGYTFGFDKDHLIDDVKALAPRIAALAQEFSNGPTGEILRERYQQRVPELSFFYLQATTDEDVLWRTQQVYSTPVISSASLKRIVANKEVKAR